MQIASALTGTNTSCGLPRIVALRSNCMKRKVAAVVVKDRRIICNGLQRNSAWREELQ